MAIRADWWNISGPKYNDLNSITSDIQARRKPQQQKEQEYVRMYNNRESMGMESFSYYKIDPRNRANEDTVRFNAVAAIIDTLTSKLATEQPRVVSLINGADFAIRSKSRGLQKFVDGILKSSGAYDEAITAFRDAEIVGTGVLRVYSEWGNIKCERVPKHEILIDDEEAYYGQLSQAHQIKNISRFKLIEMFPKKAKEIRAAPRIEGEFIKSIDIADLIQVTESWHLPSGPKAKDGRHVISIQTADLVDEDYKEKGLPLVFIKWKEPVFGFWGTGIAEELRPLQIEINRLLAAAHRALKAASNPMVFIDAGSQISKSHLTNEIGVIIPYVGKVPEIRVHQTVHQEVFQQIENLFRKCFEIIGISMLSSSGQKPAGVNAAVAMRELQDIESERFSVALMEYSNAFIEVASKMIILARALYTEDESDTYVDIKSAGFLESVNWADIDLDEDKFVLELDVANKLPLTRSGKISTITEWYQAGIIDGDQWRDLISMPDTSEEQDLRNAPKEYIREVVYNILYKGELEPPEAHDDIAFAYKYSIMQYQKAKLDKFPEDRIDLLAQYMAMLEFKISEIKAQQAPPPEAAPGPPGAGGPPGAPQGPKPQVPVPAEASSVMMPQQ